MLTLSQRERDRLVVVRQVAEAGQRHSGRPPLAPLEEPRLPVHRAAGGRLVPQLPRDREQDRRGVPVRVIEYQLEGVEDAEPLYRLLTTLLDPDEAPAPELAALYHERWEVENAFDELKIHLRGARIVLRSRTPDLVVQEFYGLLLALYAVRSIMHRAALGADIDPDTVSAAASVGTASTRATRGGFR